MAKGKIILLRVFLKPVLNLTALITVIHTCKNNNNNNNAVTIIMDLYHCFLKDTYHIRIIEPSIRVRIASHLVFYWLSLGICGTVVIKNTNCEIWKHFSHGNVFDHLYPNPLRLMWQNRVIEKHIPKTSITQTTMTPIPVFKRFFSNVFFSFVKQPCCQ